MDVPGTSSIVVLTGAGVSAESGVATFRGAGGLWAEYRAEDLATPEAFRARPEIVHAFYNARRRQLLEASVAPNAAHEALARLEREWPGGVLLVTQNVDDLHERAGSRPLHMHGEILKVRCIRSGTAVPWTDDLDSRVRCSCCGLAGTSRPHVVWFGEVPFHLDRIQEALLSCGLFVAIGTSGQVYPAAGFVEIARSGGRARTVEINLERTPVSGFFDRSILGRAAEEVPAFVDRLLSGAATDPTSA